VLGVDGRTEFLETNFGRARKLAKKLSDWNGWGTARTAQDTMGHSRGHVVHTQTLAIPLACGSMIFEDEKIVNEIVIVGVSRLWWWW